MAAASLRIDWLAFRIRQRTALFCELLARADAGVKQVHCIELVQGGLIVIHVLALDAHRSFEFNAEPLQVPDGCRDEFRFATGGVDVLNPQQQASARQLRHFLVQQSGVGMAQMKPAIGTGGKAENWLRHGLFLGVF